MLKLVLRLQFQGSLIYSKQFLKSKLKVQTQTANEKTEEVNARCLSLEAQVQSLTSENNEYNVDESLLTKLKIEVQDLKDELEQRDKGWDLIDLVHTKSVMKSNY